MSQRPSGYERKELDCYETPAWVTDALVRHLPQINGRVWEPACASGKMVNALKKHGFDVDWSDIASETSVDFLRANVRDYGAIITNPPYAYAFQFIVHALELTNPRGVVAMLLRTDYDHAASRLNLFRVAPFAKKVVLTRRIKWFEDSKGQPSFNHAWFIWDWKHQGPPTLAYGP